jgi:lipoprotein-anchoring transpeptidase ErfK/SrfK
LPNPNVRAFPWLVVAVATVVVSTFASPARAGAGLTLLPGSTAGGVNTVGLKHGETARWVAMHYGVHPVRVKADQDDYGSLRVDTRHVIPAFDPSVSGLVLNVPEAEVYLVKDGEIERHYPVAVSAPDKPMPLGLTQVVSKEKDPAWHIPVSIQKEMGRRAGSGRTVVPAGPHNPLGPRWIGFWNGNFGMHGTNVPTSIKQYASHGCVRFRASDIKDLYDRVSIGTPIRVVYQPVVLGVDNESIWLQVYPDIYKHHFDYHGSVASLARLTGLQDRVNWAAVAAAVAHPNGIITNIGPGGGFHQAVDPTASLEEVVGRHAAATKVVVHRPPSRPPAARPVVAPQPHERLIPEDQVPAGLVQQDPEPTEALPESPPAPWYTNP